MYRIVFSDDAMKDLKELNEKAPLAIKKLSKLLEEIQEHLRTGTGQVEPLKDYDGNVYSRRITHEHTFLKIRLYNPYYVNQKILKRSPTALFHKKNAAVGRIIEINYLCERLLENETQTAAHNLDMPRLLII